jgi:hypothetical protein
VSGEAGWLLATRITCPRCGGSGVETFTPWKIEKPCERCQGKGSVLQPKETHASSVDTGHVDGVDRRPVEEVAREIASHYKRNPESPGILLDVWAVHLEQAITDALKQERHRGIEEVLEIRKDFEARFEESIRLRGELTREWQRADGWESLAKATQVERDKSGKWCGELQAQLADMTAQRDVLKLELDLAVERSIQPHEIHKICEERDTAQALLRECASTFNRYAEMHRAKGTEEGNRKADENAFMARRIEDALKGVDVVDAKDALLREGVEVTGSVDSVLCWVLKQASRLVDCEDGTRPDEVLDACRLRAAAWVSKVRDTLEVERRSTT